MIKVLVTGMSGTGKSALLTELAARGHRAVDTDYGDFYETVGGERLWRPDRISALLDSAPDDQPGLLFVQGTTRNQGLFYPRFQHIVLLSAPPEVLIERLAARTTNPYGKNPAELAAILRDQLTVEPLLRASATLEIVTTIPISRVADLIVQHVAARLAALAERLEPQVGGVGDDVDLVAEGPFGGPRRHHVGYRLG